MRLLHHPTAGEFWLVYSSLDMLADLELEQEMLRRLLGLSEDGWLDLPIFAAAEYRRQYAAFFQPLELVVQEGAQTADGHRRWWAALPADADRQFDAPEAVWAEWRDPTVRERDAFVESGGHYWPLVQAIATRPAYPTLGDMPASDSLALIQQIGAHTMGPLELALAAPLMTP